MEKNINYLIQISIFWTSSTRKLKLRKFYKIRYLLNAIVQVLRVFGDFSECLYAISLQYLKKPMICLLYYDNKLLWWTFSCVIYWARFNKCIFRFAECKFFNSRSVYIYNYKDLSLNSPRWIFEILSRFYRGHYLLNVA